MCYNLLLFGKRDTGINLDFTGGALPSGVTFTRASAGGTINSSGDFEQLSTDAPRFFYDPDTLECLGLLYEGSLQYIQYPSDIALSSQTQIGLLVSDDAVTGADGLTSAASLTENTDTSEHSIRSTLYLPYVNIGNVRTHYAILKAGTSTVAQIQVPLCGSEAYANFDLANGVLGAVGTSATARMEAYGNGFYKCSVTATATSAGGSSRFLINGCNNNTSASFDPSYTGSASRVFYAWEQGVYVGSSNASHLQVASGSAATRAADNAEFTILEDCTLRFTFSDDSTQDVAVSAGTYTIPTTLDKPIIKRIQQL